MRGKIGDHEVKDLAAQLVDIAHQGLAARAVTDDEERDETKFLQPLKEVISTQKTPADVMLELYHGAWDGNIDHVFRERHY